MHAKRDGVGGYACGRQAVVVDGWPVRDGVAAAAYAASSILASAASKSDVLLRLKAQNCRASRPYPGPW